VKRRPDILCIVENFAVTQSRNVNAELVVGHDVSQSFTCGLCVYARHLSAKVISPARSVYFTSH